MEHKILDPSRRDARVHGGRRAGGRARAPGTESDLGPAPNGARPTAIVPAQRRAARDPPARARQVVPGDDRVVDPEDHVGNVEIVVPGRGQSLEARAPVVADVAGGAALKGRELRVGLARERRQERAHDAERVAIDHADLAGAGVDQLGPRVLAADHDHGVGGHERVAAEALGVAGAVEEEAVGLARGRLERLEHRWGGGSVRARSWRLLRPSGARSSAGNARVRASSGGVR